MSAVLKTDPDIIEACGNSIQQASGMGRVLFDLRWLVDECANSRRLNAKEIRVLIDNANAFLMELERLRDDMNAFGQRTKDVAQLFRNNDDALTGQIAQLEDDLKLTIIRHPSIRG